jgi:AcrR family transcriptional regulator
MTARSPTRKELTHDRIVEVAARAIRRGGYEGVGLADLMKEAGLTHGGFYAHFASRKALMAEATLRAALDTSAVLGERLLKRQAQGMSPLSALVNTYLADTQLDNLECGCVVAALASEIPRQDQEVASAARASVMGLLELVRRNLPAGVDQRQAEVVAATMVGALQLARALGGKSGKAWLANARASLIEQYEG